MQYMVVGPDGKEYGPASTDTLKQWASENRLAPSSQLRSFETGQLVLASSLTEVFPSAAAVPPPMGTPAPMAPPGPQGGAWTTPPSPSNYIRPNPAGYRQSSGDGTSDVIWAIVRSGLAILFFFVLHGIGLLFGGYAIYYAYRGYQAGHKLAWLAITISVVTFIAILIGWIIRLSAGGSM